jgi:hypothetical protein
MGPLRCSPIISMATLWPLSSIDNRAVCLLSPCHATAALSPDICVSRPKVVARAHSRSHSAAFLSYISARDIIVTRTSKLARCSRGKPFQRADAPRPVNSRSLARGLHRELHTGGSQGRDPHHALRAFRRRCLFARAAPARCYGRTQRAKAGPCVCEQEALSLSPILVIETCPCGR